MKLSNESIIAQFEDELRVDLQSEIYKQSSVYIVNGSQESFKGKIAIALLPFCIKNPNCYYRRKPMCDFSLHECFNDTTKFICDTFNEKKIPFYFNVNLGSIRNSVEDYLKKYRKLESCIVVCCPKEIIEIKEEFTNYIKKYDAPVLLFLLENYEDCKINGLGSRDFQGQTTLNIELFREAIKKLF